MSAKSNYVRKNNYGFKWAFMMLIMVCILCLIFFIDGYNRLEVESSDDLLNSQNSIANIQDHSSNFIDESSKKFESAIVFSKGRFFYRDSAIFYYKQALKEAEVVGNVVIEGKSLYELGFHNVTRDSLSLAFSYLKSLEERSLALGNDYLKNLAYLGLGIAHHKAHHLDSGLIYYEKAYY